MINKTLVILLFGLLIEASSTPFPLQTQCQGLHPVYDDHGNLIGQRGVCDVDHWDGHESQINSMHPIDTHSLVPHSESSSWFGGLFGGSGHHDTDHHHHHHIDINHVAHPPPDVGLFDWLSPHHDLIRNRPEYRSAHVAHHHCIQKKKEGLFDFLGNLFGSSTGSSHDHVLNDDHHQDPYGTHSRCLNSDYYHQNPFHQDDNQFDPYSLHVGTNIHHLKNQINNPNSVDDLDTLKSSLHTNYDRLHRHLDCHCNHELPSSEMHHIHHRPISHHSMHMIAHPDPNQTSPFPLQLHSSMPLDPSMDMEDEHMSLMRLSGHAAQSAYNSGHFNQNSPMESDPLRMHVFHPVNHYAGTTTTTETGMYDDPEWNKLRVEKVIIIKRIKIPVIKKVSVPVPVKVPVPYPVMVPSPANTGDDDAHGPNHVSAHHSAFTSAQPGYMGKNTYLMDSDSSSMPTSSIVHALSGAPCQCMNTGATDTDTISHHVMSHHAMNPMAHDMSQHPMCNNMMDPMMGASMMNPMAMNPMMSHSMMNPMMSENMMDPMMSQHMMNPMANAMNPMMSQMHNPMMDPMMSQHEMMNPMMSQMHDPMMAAGIMNQMHNPMMDPMSHDIMNPMAMSHNMMGAGMDNPMMSASLMNPMASATTMNPMLNPMMNPMMGQQYNHQNYQNHSSYNPMTMQPGIQLSPYPPHYNYPRRRRDTFFDRLGRGIKYHAADRIANGLVNGLANRYNNTSNNNSNYSTNVPNQTQYQPQTIQNASIQQQPQLQQVQQPGNIPNPAQSQIQPLQQNNMQIQPQLNNIQQPVNFAPNPNQLPPVQPVQTTPHQ